MKKNILAGILLSTVFSYADYIDVGFGVDKVLPTLNGKLVDGSKLFEVVNGQEPEAITDQLDNTMLWLDIKHPIPVIPNIKIEKTKMTITSFKDTQEPINFIYDGIDYSFAGHNTQSTISEVVFTDFTPYYNVLDEAFWLTLNVGVTIREAKANLKYEVSQYTNVTGEEELLKTLVGSKEIERVFVPLAYINTEIDIPDSNFTVEGTYRGVKYHNNSLNEFKLGLGYTSNCGSGLRVGYQETYLNSDALDNYKLDMNLQTFYLGAFYRF